MRQYCFVVFTKPVPGEEAEYNRWYDEQHIPDVEAIPGIVRGQRFVATIDGEKQYLALYDIISDDPAAVLLDIRDRARTDLMPMSPALDPDSTSAVLYEALSPITRSTANSAS